MNPAGPGLGVNVLLLPLCEERITPWVLDAKQVQPGATAQGPGPPRWGEEPPCTGYSVPTGRQWQLWEAGAGGRDLLRSFSFSPGLNFFLALFCPPLSSGPSLASSLLVAPSPPSLLTTESSQSAPLLSPPDHAGLSLLLPHIPPPRTPRVPGASRSSSLSHHPSLCPGRGLLWDQACAGTTQGPGGRGRPGVSPERLIPSLTWAGPTSSPVSPPCAQSLLTSWSSRSLGPFQTVPLSHCWPLGSGPLLATTSYISLLS